ncbi:uncharacterized protein Z520_03330 [Fonsecaea multimorphosa CBS 102226]|uniref:PAS domain-containing protein n=1 Tax=Fonsecaea multimorphosa CBS 102226 TaxID=1442371 RepID=A0A0D2KC33_9EURO|nr:uncharacterized protein Z520_03330 [Fonsecaea multimorphosa CBS 102226]KIY00665.1 hypothetical protein Z520_03330 [Fonsecaea multimorphosa CBS 102226]OAL27949.1 hypothetical protein AYO22_03164 [Fonsecaea multimorphosa]
METVFITIHDLSQDARIRYCSDSVEDILGYFPHEVTGRSCWDYFHPEEIPFARAVHGRGISLDKAAVMNYCRIKHKDGHWVGCECVFTVVHDVLVASTAIYRRGPKARQRALDGAGIRRIFSSSPRDPRYHMLSYLSNKFYDEPAAHMPEPRAALFLNRFSRTSTVMFATSGVDAILGLQPSDLVGKSFYQCIDQACLQDAVKCIESAKANDSIAYLRFWYHDPLQANNIADGESVGDESDEDDDGGVPLETGTRPGSSVSMGDASTPRQTEDTTHVTDNQALRASEEASTSQVDGIEPGNVQLNGDHVAPSTSTDLVVNEHEALSDHEPVQNSAPQQAQPGAANGERLELEAVVSCTSDGLVVILRRARPLVPHTLGATEAPYYANGLFASPWAPEPVMPPTIQQTTVAPAASFPMTDSSESGFMAAIREVAVFAWSLTGINGSLAQYARGKASPEALPPDGLPIWDPNAEVDAKANQLYNGFLGSAHRPYAGPHADSGESNVAKKVDDLGSSDDEVLWKRAPTMTPWRRPKRRAHHDAFGGEGNDGVDGGNEDGRRKKATRSHSSSGPSSGSGGASAAGSSSGST